MFDPNVDKPAFRLPEHACDSHFHIFGDPKKYPFGTDLRYQPHIASAQDYQVFRDLVGFERTVLVQPSCFGTDNRCQLDAAAEFGLDRARVVLDLPDDVSDRELADFHARGARGIRINFKPILPLTAGLVEKTMPRVLLWEARCKELGWSLDFLLPDWLTTEFIPHMDKLRCNFTIAHMGMNKGCNGTTSQGFRKLRDLVANGEGYCYIKLTAPYRITNDPDYLEIVPMAQELAEAAPERLIWGSDYPHASFTQHNTVKIFNLIPQLLPDEATRKKVLVDNPARLYGFDL